MDGIISLIKPPGMTSHDIIHWIRRTLEVKKAGHTGTLDPGAAGITSMHQQATKLYLTWMKILKYIELRLILA